MSTNGPPKNAQVVVVGGGIIGCSVAYHLAELGWTDIVLLERDKLTAGTTWHAAGLMTAFGSTSETSIEMRKYTREMCTKLEEETGLSTGFKAVGLIEVAADADRLEEYRRVTAFNRWHGIDVEEISPREVKELFPLAEVSDLQAGFYVKDDGRVNPVDLTMAFAKGARMKGVNLIQGITVTGVKTNHGRVTGVTTNQGDIQTDYVVNCAGMWARQFGELSGVNIPNQAAEHYYLITEEIKDLPKDMPVLEDPSCHGYYREETGGLMIGLFEPDCAPWKVDGIPEDFSFGEIAPDWDRMMPFLEKAMSRVPITMELGMKKFFCGPESFTPDFSPIVGEAPEIKNYFVAAGMNSVGIITSGGIGRVLAHWIVNGSPDVDVTAMNIDRLHPYQNTPEFRRLRAAESLGLAYKCHYPDRPLVTARDAKRSPFHDRLAAQGAYFRDVSGWESPAWYAPEGVEPKIEQLSWGRQNWFPYWEAEHQACRDGVILMDMTFMSKFLVQGRDAGKVLNNISANEVDGKCGIITYTQWLSEPGKFEADLTVIKFTDDEFMVVASDTMHRHVETWLKRHIDDEARATVTDVTQQYGQLNVQGPKSRDLLQSLTSADLSNEAFPFRTVRDIDIGIALVTCVRITYVGELGYELNIPASQATYVYDRLVEAGEKFGLKHAGLKSLASLRLEKAYRDFGHDIDNTDDPYEVGLGFAVNLKTETDFIGKAACIERKAAAPYQQRLVQIFVEDPQPMLYHAEIVYRNGKAVGDVRAGSYGHTLGGAVGLAFLTPGETIDNAYLEQGTWEVDIAGTRYPAKVSFQPMYDPKNERIKA
jgi:heterotetrameric sarcosine oxidase gamma subunit